MMRAINKKRFSLILLATMLNNSLYANIQKNSLDDEEMRLMYQSFIYSKDLKDAYKIAKKALMIYPDSLYWHKKMAEIALWNNKNSEALDHFSYIYNKTNDKKLANKLIKQMLATYQYKKAKKIIDKEIQDDNSDIALKNYEYINAQIGHPEYSIKELEKLYKKSKNKKYLSDIISIYVDTGEVDKVKKYIPLLKKSRDLDVKGAIALSKYFFIEKELKKSYQTLLNVKEQATPKDIKYFTHLSDLGWYLGDYNNSVYASLMLYRNNQARKVDLERIKELYLKNDIALIKKIAYHSIREYQDKKIFIEYANELIEKKRFDKLDRSIKEIINDPKFFKLFKGDAQFWLIKSMVDNHFKRIIESRDDLLKAKAIEPDSTKISSTIIWHLINNNQLQDLKLFVDKESKKKLIDPSLYFPLSSAYYNLHNYEKATYFLKKALKNSPKNIDLLFLKAQMFQDADMQKEKRETLNKIIDILTKRSQKTPSLLKDERFLTQYLTASMEFASDKRFKELLNASKQYISKEDINRLYLSNALMRKNYKEAKYYYKRLKKFEPLIEIELAKADGDYKRELDILKKAPLSISNLVKSDIYESNYMIDEAIKSLKLAKKEEGIKEDILPQLQRLYNSYTNHFSFDINHQKRANLISDSATLKNFFYLAKGYGLVSTIEHRKISYKTDSKKRIKRDEDNIYLGFKKSNHPQNIVINAGITYHNKLSKKVGYKLSIDKQLSKKAFASIKMTKNAKVTDQSTKLEVFGTKDSYLLQTSYNLDRFNTLSIYGNYLRYYLSKRYIGDGKVFNIALNHNFKQIDKLSTTLFYAYGNFNQHYKNAKVSRCITSTKSSTYKEAQEYEKLLYNDYQDIGIGLFYGDSTAYYGETLKPYFGFTSLYSTKESKTFLQVDAGITSSFTKKDKFRLSANYQNTNRGFDQNEFNLKFNYSKLY